MLSANWKDRTNLLCIRLDNMGDVLMSQPAMRALKVSVPGRKITLLTSAAGAAIAPFIPEVDEVIAFDVPWVKEIKEIKEIKENAEKEAGGRDAGGSGSSVNYGGSNGDSGTATGEEKLAVLAGELRRRRFDAAVIFTVYSQNPLPAAMLCYLAGVRNVLGYCRENPYQLISHWVPDREPLDYILHEVERQLRLVETTGAERTGTQLSLELPEQERRNMRERLASFGLGTAPWLLLHPGVTEEKRLYPASDYISAGLRLIGQGFRILLTGSAGERDYVAGIAQALGEHAFNLAGELSIAELAALIEAAPVLVSNNTGPVHVAAAVGTPVVVLYAMTNPQHTPWQARSRVLYFEVPPALRTKNRLLQIFPGTSVPRASPQAIVAAVLEFTRAAVQA